MMLVESMWSFTSQATRWRLLGQILWLLTAAVTCQQTLSIMIQNISNTVQKSAIHHANAVTYFTVTDKLLFAILCVVSDCGSQFLKQAFTQ